MTWLFMLFAYLPVVSMVLGVTLLIIGVIRRKCYQQRAKGLFISGCCCVGVCLLFGIALFLVGALGVGPVPN